MTHHGSPVAMLVPVDQAAIDDLLDREAERAEALDWLRASEGAFSFWANPEDDAWDAVDPLPRP